jgi:muramoyltetrapeptide carboxypeptidase
VGEKPYRIDRMLTQLRLSGALRKIRGVILGQFCDCDPGPDGRTVRDVFADRLTDLGVPVYANAFFGHGESQMPFAIGATARMGEGCMSSDWIGLGAIPGVV